MKTRDGKHGSCHNKEGVPKVSTRPLQVALSVFGGLFVALDELDVVLLDFAELTSGNLIAVAIVP